MHPTLTCFLAWPHRLVALVAKSGDICRLVTAQDAASLIGRSGFEFDVVCEEFTLPTKDPVKRALVGRNPMWIVVPRDMCD
jgi:hypothetical protein